MKAKDFLTTINDMFSAEYFESVALYPEKGITVAKNVLKDYYITYDVEAYDQLVGDGETVYLLTNSFQHYFALRGSREIRYFPHFNHPGKKMGVDNIKNNTVATTVAFGNIDFPRLYNNARTETKAQVQTLYDYCEANGMLIEVASGNRIATSDKDSMVSDIQASFPNIVIDTSKLIYSEITFHIGKTDIGTNPHKFTFGRTPFMNFYHFANPEIWYADEFNHTNDKNLEFLVDDGYLVFKESVDGISKYTIDSSMESLSAKYMLHMFKNIFADMATDKLAGIANVDEFTWSLLE